MIDPNKMDFRVDLDSWAGGYRLIGAVVGPVSRMLGVMLGLSGTVVLWGYVRFNIDRYSVLPI